ncbi:serine hydrolase [Mycobacteroides chelonae]|jgi:beta-lactamase class A|uniref:Serine hydrolase n=1 Tax=Mycobacteroides chelonae TaxID=1774 RepID=A0A1S1M1R3_MYCCH|nr:serine hydrolase [Mycobacteroides chelonae]PKQ57435.1 serine hydrolase [Mycobacterium sp. MHSD3]SKL74059.1 beta-lactamase [Mycobacteroides abscessus subsp. bolletii]MBF9521614.1 serine hydrolase [Mycobacteroides chelonae]OHU50073.1 serine hydrolase [Mycobacteroides chelonae]OHU75835.1 serine hydrolase [Mycobacteroides chelonae]
MNTQLVDKAVEQIRAVFLDAGCRGTLRAERVGAPGPIVDVDGDRPAVAASVYKIFVLIAAARAFDSGHLHPEATVRVAPADCTPGPTGISTFSNPVVLTWLDLARLMITHSDNTAADVLLAAIGLDTVNELTEELGFNSTRIIGGTSALQRQLIHDTGTLTLDEAIGILATNNTIEHSAAFDPAYTTATSACDTDRALSAIWTGTATSAQSSDMMKQILTQQIWQHRIRSAFPHRDVTVAGKTGTIGPIRNEVAVIAFPGEPPMAVSVFTRAARADAYLPNVDRAIGQAARIAITALRNHP